MLPEACIRLRKQKMCFCNQPRQGDAIQGCPPGRKTAVNMARLQELFEQNKTPNQISEIMGLEPHIVYRRLEVIKKKGVTI